MSDNCIAPEHEQATLARLLLDWDLADRWFLDKDQPVWHWLGLSAFQTACGADLSIGPCLAVWVDSGGTPNVRLCLVCIGLEAAGYPVPLGQLPRR